jgi:seryl-tRNA synthetase
LDAIQGSTVKINSIAQHMQENHLQVEWLIVVAKILDKYVYLSHLENPQFG